MISKKEKKTTSCEKLLLQGVQQKLFPKNFMVWQFTYVAYVRTLKLQVRTYDWSLAYVVTYTLFLFI